MDNMIEVKRLRGGTLFKLVFVGNAVFLTALTLLMGGLAFFGANTLQWNGEYLTGLPALLAAPFMGVFMALVFSALAWISLFCGLWLYSRFRTMRLEYIPVEDGR